MVDQSSFARSLLVAALLTQSQMSSNRNLTRSQARSLLSIARLKIARLRFDHAISNRTRIDHTCFGSRGFFWPTSNPLFQGLGLGLTRRTGMEDPPPSRPPCRSSKSGSSYNQRPFCAFKKALQAASGAPRSLTSRKGKLPVTTERLRCSPKLFPCYFD